MTLYPQSPLKGVVLILVCFLTMHCADNSQQQSAPETEDPPFEQPDDPTATNASNPGSEKATSPLGLDLSGDQLDMSAEISQFNVQQSRIKRNEVFARHGLLFEDQILRNYFWKHNWYEPSHEYDGVVTPLSAEEKAYADKVLAHEKKLLEQNFVQEDGKSKVNLQNIVNHYQFDPGAMLRTAQPLRDHGVALIESDAEQLFHIYDQGHYEDIPAFVTTDLYLQLFHMYFSFMLKRLEQKHFSPTITQLSKQLYEEAKKMEAANTDPAAKEAAQFNQVYFGMAYSIMTGEKLTMPGQWQSDYDETRTKIEKASGKGSKLLDWEYFDYSLFKPRGHYTRTAALKQYFKAMMWLQNAPMMFKNAPAINGMLLTAHSFNHNPQLLKQFNAIYKPIEFFVGQPDNLSIVDLMQVLKEQPTMDLISLMNPSYQDPIFRAMDARDPERIKFAGTDQVTKDELSKKRMHFMPQRYTLDGEILQRIIEMKKGPSGKPFRPMPKGLDVFAALNNRTAEDILLHTYKEMETWPAYGDTLQALQDQFLAFEDWDRSVYNKWMHGLNKLFTPTPTDQFFAQSHGWELKNLNTALGSWAELKHDVILYAKQPMGAQMGDGEDFPDPKMFGYIEPNVAFWENALALLALNREVMDRYGYLNDSDEASRTRQMEELAQKCLDIVKKEVAGQELTIGDYDFIKYIGGQVEYLTLYIMGEGLGYWFEVKGPDKFLAVVADVYTHHAENAEDSRALEEAVGFVDKLYVVVEHKGYLYLTQGASFSYYEFHQHPDERLTDEEWQEMLRKGEAPEQPVWIKEIKVDAPAQ